MTGERESRQETPGRRYVRLLAISAIANAVVSVWFLIEYRQALPYVLVALPLGTIAMTVLLEAKWRMEHHDE